MDPIEDRSTRVRASQVPGAAAVAFAIAAISCAPPAFAYVDPNLGGLFFQLFAPLLVLLLAFWNRVKAIAARAFELVRNLLSRKRQ